MGNLTDEELFARLLEHARPRLQALLNLHRVAPEDGEDVLQEALLALWRKRAQVKDYEAWLFSAVRMECLRYRTRETADLFRGGRARAGAAGGPCRLGRNRAQSASGSAKTGPTLASPAPGLAPSSLR